MLAGSQTVSVGQLTEYISRTLQANPQLIDVTVEGELSNFIHHRSGHMYFTLKDKDCSIKGVMFQSWNRRLRFRPENGQQVYVRGDVVVYKRGGNYQLNIYAMEPAGQGALALAFVQLKEKLDREGLFAEHNKLPLPKFPQRIGLVTSAQGAALHDFRVTAANLGWPVTIELVPATVQGSGGVASVVAAMELLNQRNVDVIVVTRGGGSLEELWVFNEEEVARAVANSSVPVISAVGHETDFTICDFAADARAATPTAAARLIVPDLAQWQQQLAFIGQRMEMAVAASIQRRRQQLDTLQQRPILSRPVQVLLQPRQNLDHTSYRLNTVYTRLLEQRRHKLAALAARLADLNPLTVLARGFAVVRDDKGIINSVKQLQVQQQIEIRLRDGLAQATITALEGEQDVRPKV